jgi:predicted DCC family thiol-disulfide oxidoreductase YuxK
LEFLAYDSAEAERRLPAIRHLHADQEILVMADTGEVWQGAGAWVLCLWALREYRGWSARLASPSMQLVARKVVHWISQNRIGMSRLAGFKSDAELSDAAEKEMEEPVCRLRHDLDLID